LTPGMKLSYEMSFSWLSCVSQTRYTQYTLLFFA
jgi:hypothetical protein